MGGHAGGEIAAQLAVEGLAWAFDENRDRDGLVEAAQAANHNVHRAREHDEALRGMGTTLTAAALVHRRNNDSLIVVNVGDSRGYLLESGRLVQITEDHSLVEQMVRHGEITPAEALVHPHRHILTRALGIDAGVDVDSFVIEPHAGMRLLICSDGLTNELLEPEIAEVLQSVRDRDAAAKELVKARAPPRWQRQRHRRGRRRRGRRSRGDHEHGRSGGECHSPGRRRHRADDPPAPGAESSPRAP